MSLRKCYWLNCLIIFDLHVVYWIPWIYFKVILEAADRLWQNIAVALVGIYWLCRKQKLINNQNRFTKNDKIVHFHDSLFTYHLGIISMFHISLLYCWVSQLPVRYLWIKPHTHPHFNCAYDLGLCLQIFLSHFLFISHYKVTTFKSSENLYKLNYVNDGKNLLFLPSMDILVLFLLKTLSNIKISTLSLKMVRLYT